jgi:hypothetical protein
MGMRKGNPTESVDLIVKSLLAMGASKRVSPKPFLIIYNRAENDMRLICDDAASTVKF